MTVEYTRRAVDFINRNRDQPFFLYLPYTIPHTNNELGRETGNGQQVPSDAPYSGRDWPQVEKNYAAMVHMIDQDVGKVLSKVESLDLNSNTIIFFTSDNGPGPPISRSNVSVPESAGCWS